MDNEKQKRKEKKERWKQRDSIPRSGWTLSHGAWKLKIHCDGV